MSRELSQSFKGKFAVITGSTQGLGEGLRDCLQIGVCQVWLYVAGMNRKGRKWPEQNQKWSQQGRILSQKPQK